MYHPHFPHPDLVYNDFVETNLGTSVWTSIIPYSPPGTIRTTVECWNLTVVSYWKYKFTLLQNASRVTARASTVAIIHHDNHGNPASNEWKVCCALTHQLLPCLAQQRNSCLVTVISKAPILINSWTPMATDDAKGCFALFIGKNFSKYYLF